MAFGSRLREMMKKYGTVALGVHCSISMASITGLYIAINNNVNIEPLLEKVGLASHSNKQENQTQNEQISGSDMADSVFEEKPISVPSPKRNKTAELAASSGGALALALLCNKALFPVRVPITIALTPPIHRFLARRRIIKTHV